MADTTAAFTVTTHDGGTHKHEGVRRIDWDEHYTTFVDSDGAGIASYATFFVQSFVRDTPRTD